MRTPLHSFTLRSKCPTTALRMNNSRSEIEKKPGIDMEKEPDMDIEEEQDMNIVSESSIDIENNIHEERLGIDDFFFRLKAVHKACKPVLETGVATRIDLEEGEVPSEARVWCSWAWAAYQKSKDDVAKELKDLEEIHPAKPDDFYLNSNKLYFPCYFVAKKDDQIVISVRGTEGLIDDLTDATITPDDFEYDNIDGKAHSGFLKAARNILKYLGDRIARLIQQNPKCWYNVVVTGHSLGGAVSVILSFLLKEKLKNQGLSSIKLECWTFGCPPCVSKNFYTKADFIHNVVLNDDVVSRISARNFLITLNENSDGIYLDKLDYLRKNVIGNAVAIRKTIEEKREEYNGRGTDLVCPGVIYHLLLKSESQSETTKNSSYILRKSSNPVDGLSLIVCSENMFKNHTEYPKWLKQYKIDIDSFSLEIESTIDPLIGQLLQKVETDFKSPPVTIES